MAPSREFLQNLHDEGFQLKDVLVRVPTDVQSQYRPLLDATTTNLGAGATYTGTSVDVSDLAFLTWHVYSDNATTVVVEQSMDGTNWDVTESFTVSATTTTPQAVIECVGSHARIKITNDGADSTATLRGYLYGRTL